MRGLIAVMVMAALAATGCSATPSRWSGPFGRQDPAAHAAGYIKGPVVVGGIYDIAVPDFRNHTDRSVRVVSVQLVSPRSGIRVIGAWAYPYSRLLGRGTAVIDEGDLAKGCPELYAQHPVTDVVLKPHADTDWYVVIALAFREPGRHYHFGLARIGYMTAGKMSWQYYRLPNAFLHTVPKQGNADLYRPNTCAKGTAPTIGVLDVYSSGHGGWTVHGDLYDNGKVNPGSSAAVWLRSPDGRLVKEKFTGGRWQRTGKTIAICLQLAAASRSAPAAGTICARGVPVNGHPVKAADSHGRTTQIRVSWIPGASQQARS